MVGKTISHYQILEKIGEGGMGVVYKARDTHLDRSVALKFLHSAEDVPRLLREAKTAASLNHPNICAVHEVAPEHGFIAMELVEGQSLAVRIAGRPLPVEEAVGLAVQICEGLKAAHAKGIIHRDIKSGNVLVTEDGHAKILDFGLARMAGQAALTREGAAAGTPGYMAPEQARGEPVDRRTDIWAVGAVLHEMLTGRPPLGQIETLPEGLGRVVRKALAAEPGERYQHIDDMLVDLRRVAGTPSVKPSRRPWLWVAAAVAAAILVTVLVLVDIGGLRTRLAAWMKAPEPSIRLAVLPFTNLSGDPGQEDLSDGMTEEMIAELGGLHPASLSVIARASVMRYKGGKTPIDQVGRELGVDYLLESSLRLEGQRVRITAELIRVRTQTVLWAQSFERELAGVLALQSEVAKKVAGSLALKLLPREQAQLAAARPVNPEAYQAVLRGNRHLFRITPEEVGAGLGYFELALKNDPNYAPAYVAIAWVWLIRGQNGYTAPREAGPKGKAAALKAIELDDTLVGGHVLLALVYFFYEWDWAAAGAEWERVIELRPNGRGVHYTDYLMAMKRPEEAMAEMQRYVQLNPFAGNFRLLYAGIFLNTGRYDEAIVQSREALRLSPRNPGAHWVFAVSLFRKSRYEESLAEFKAYFNYLGIPELSEALTQAYAQSGYSGALRRAADLLAERSRKTYVIPCDIAALYAMAGDQAPALAWLEKGLEARDPNMVRVGVMAEFETLHNTPGFRDILRRMNLPQ